MSRPSAVASTIVAMMTEKPSHIIATACIVAFAAGLAEFSILVVLAYLKVSQFSLRVQHCTLTGIVSGAFVWALLTMVSLRRDYMQAKLSVVANLNHELRNALEVILQSEYLPDDKRHAALHESAERLNKVLTELLDEARTNLRGPLQ